MPEHIHMIVNPRDGRIREFTGKLKGLCAKSLVSVSPSGKFKVNDEGIHQVWQESFKGRSFMERLDDLAEDKLHSPESG